MTALVGCEIATKEVEASRRHIPPYPKVNNSDTVSLALLALDQCPSNPEHNKTKIIHSLPISPTSMLTFSLSFVRLFRLIVVDLSLLLLFSSYVILVLVHKTRDELLQPQLKLMEWNDYRRSQELTYYHRDCDKNDLTTLNVQDLLIRDHFTVPDCVHHQMIHGMSTYPNVLNSNTSDILRQYILDRNAQLTLKDSIHVLSNQNRWSFGISVHDHPVIALALSEIASHGMFRPALEEIVGKNPAIIEFTAITSAYGAEDQIWHADVLSSGSAARYAKSFLPSYSFFIPLQDITAEMGATTICPGTYMCNSQETSFCDQYCFQASGESVWRKGYGVFMNQQSLHRGAAHVDPDAPHRVLFIVTFAPRPMKRAETRQIGQGGSYSMKWDMWGHCLSDLKDATNTITFPWSYLRALGLYKSTSQDWGWDYISMVSMRVANSDTGYKNSDLKTFSEKNPLGLPRFLLPFSLLATDDPTWSDYWLSLLIFCKQALWKINIIVNLVYIIILFGLGLAIVQVHADLNKNLSGSYLFRQFVLFIFSPVRRLLLSYGLSAVFVLFIWKMIDSSQWAVDVRKKNLYTSAFSRHQIKPFLVDRTTMHVHRNDILVSTRSTSRHYASFNHFMDYHPGNQFLINELDTGKPTILIDYINFIERIVSNNGNHFLFQSSKGDWVEMTNDEKKWYIKRLLCLKWSKIGAILDQAAEHILSDTLYSATMSQTMSHNTRAVIYLIFRRIHLCGGETLLSINKFYKINDSPYSGGNWNTPTKKLHKFHRLRDSLKLPIRIESLISAERRPQSQPITNVMNIHRFKVGDIVEARYHGKGNEWYRGKIVHIHGGGMFDVIYDDGDKDISLTSSSVKPFDGYMVDETVQASLSIDGKQEWFSGTIIESDEKNELVTLAFDDDEVMEFSYRVLRRLD